MRHKTMEDVKQAFPVWFSKETMQFFDSRVHDTLYGGRYFVSSEKFRGFHCPDGERLFTVREVTKKGINTVGDFQAYATRHEAHKDAKELGQS